MAYNFAFFDECSKREIRRALLKAIAIPGFQVPFASREMPIARGWGTGGLQITLSIIEPDDCLKVIDQGSDESTNAINIKKLIQLTTGVTTTDDTAQASLIQSRHRIPEKPLRADQILVLQVPIPEPLRVIEPSEFVTARLHGDAEYTGAWVHLYDRYVRYGMPESGADHPVMVHQRYVSAPSPIPRIDNPKLHHNRGLVLFGAGREKRIYAIPPFTDVASLAFDDVPFSTEASDHRCSLCGAKGVFMDEVQIEDGLVYQCNDTSFCLERRNHGSNA